MEIKYLILCNNGEWMRVTYERFKKFTGIKKIII